MPEDKLLTLAEVAERLRLTKQTVWRQVKAGAIPAVKPFRRWLVRESAVEALVQKAKE